MIEIIGISVVVVILMYFLFPAFIELCEDLGAFFLEGIKNAFIETNDKWKELLRWWKK